MIPPNELTTLAEYQVAAAKFALYPKDQGVVYTAAALAGEAGEYVGKVSKIIRGDYNLEAPGIRQKLVDELGDVLWYLSGCCDSLGVSLREVALNNLSKLTSRAERDLIKGDGDDR